MFGDKNGILGDPAVIIKLKMRERCQMDAVLGLLKLLYRRQIRYVLNNLEAYICRITKSISSETDFESFNMTHLPPNGTIAMAEL